MFPYLLQISEKTEENSRSDDSQPVEYGNEEQIGKSMPIISNILIWIDEVDADGNIIESRVVETQETNELPPSEEPPIIIK